MIFLTGDTHGGAGYDGISDTAKITPVKFPQGKTLTKKDVLIILGDFGFVFESLIDGLYSNYSTEPQRLEWLNNQPWTTLFIDGNHENFNRLNRLPEVNLDLVKGPVGKVADSIYHLKRGHIYTIESSTFFVMGGAKSIDKQYRTIGADWWPEEEPSYMDMNRGLVNLENIGNQVDYILTHTAPLSIIKKFQSGFQDEMACQIERYFNEIFNTTHFTKWFFAHWHIDQEFENNKFQCLYQKVIKLT